MPRPVIPQATFITIMPQKHHDENLGTPGFPRVPNTSPRAEKKTRAKGKNKKTKAED